MTQQLAIDDVALARVITANFAKRQAPLLLAQAILKSGVIRDALADAWDEGLTAALEDKTLDGTSANPYRAGDES